MIRITGTYRTTRTSGEDVRAFLPHPLPPVDPELRLDSHLERLLQDAMAALGRLEVAGVMVPSADWFLYGFVRKEALLSSQIEGTQATLEDVMTYEATRRSDRPADVEVVCNCVDALSYMRSEARRPKGLPLGTRLLCQAHQRRMTASRPPKDSSLSSRGTGKRFSKSVAPQFPPSGCSTNYPAIRS